MCGICGALSPASPTAETLTSIGNAMADTLRHRGPDRGGVWADPASGLVLGHRRLSIIDLSDEGAQPMHSACGRWTIVFNGEIYNFQAIRCELAHSHEFRGHSDTEVLLAAIREWGVRAALERCIGMFAFALWDRRRRRLLLARDRLGKKPLYYGWSGATLIFGSELKALRAHPSFAADIDRASVALFLRHGYIPAPFSVYEGISKLPAGTTLTFDGTTAAPLGEPEPYWSARDTADAGMRDPFSGSEKEAADELHALLQDAVGIRMVADVPLGAFLSGGIDSSLVVALMQAQTDRPVRTFTVGFDERGYDEAPAARAVAAHLGTDHTDIYVSPDEAQAVIPALPTIFDEPFADSSQIPTFLIARLARRHVTVALTGDGGDESFGGYGRYHAALSRWRRVSGVPAPIRRLAGSALGAMAPPDGRAARLADALREGSAESLYRATVSLWTRPGALVGLRTEPLSALTDRARWARQGNIVERLMLLDTISYLPDDVLVKVDRASMATSLEARAPLLDHRVVELAWRLPLAMKVRDGSGKRILRQLLHRYVPPALVERPKAGFGVPIGSWLRGPLRQWADALLDPVRMRDEGLIRPEPVQAAWRGLLAGKVENQGRLWAVLMLQAWLEAR